MRKRMSRLALLSALACFGVLLLPACGGTGDSIEERARQAVSANDDSNTESPDTSGDLALANPASGEGVEGADQEKDELDLSDLIPLEDIDEAAAETAEKEAAPEAAAPQEKDELDLDDLDQIGAGYAANFLLVGHAGALHNSRRLLQ